MFGGDFFFVDCFNDSVGEWLGRVGLDGRCVMFVVFKVGVDR